MSARSAPTGRSSPSEIGSRLDATRSVPTRSVKAAFRWNVYPNAFPSPRTVIPPALRATRSRNSEFVVGDPYDWLNVARSVWSAVGLTTTAARGESRTVLGDVAVVAAEGEREVEPLREVRRRLGVEPVLGHLVAVLEAAEDGSLGVGPEELEVGPDRELLAEPAERDVEVVLRLGVVEPAPVDGQERPAKAPGRDVRRAPGVGRVLAAVVERVAGVVGVDVRLGKQAPGLEADLAVRVREVVGLRRPDPGEELGLHRRPPPVDREEDVVREAVDGRGVGVVLPVPVVARDDLLAEERVRDRVGRVELEVVALRVRPDNLVPEPLADGPGVPHRPADQRPLAALERDGRAGVGERVLRDKVDDALAHARPVERRARPADDLDPVEVDRRDRHERERVERERRDPGLAVVGEDEGGPGERAVEPAEDELAPVEPGLRVVDPGHVLERLGRGRGHLLRDLLRAQDGDRGRRVEHLLLPPRRRDHDVVEVSPRPPAARR